MSDEAVEFNDEIPMLTPVQVVGGGIRIGPNPNLETDATVVTLEVVAVLPTPDGPELGMLPILMEPEVWDMLIAEQSVVTPEEEA